MKNLIILMSIILISISSCKKEEQVKITTPPIDTTVTIPKDIWVGHYKDAGNYRCESDMYIFKDSVTGAYYIKGLDHVTCNKNLLAVISNLSISVEAHYPVNNTIT